MGRRPIKRGPARALYLGVCSAHTNSPFLNFFLKEEERALYGARPWGEKLVLVSALLRLGGCAARLSQLTHPVKGLRRLLGPLFLPSL